MAVIAPVSEQDYIDAMIAQQNRYVPFPDIEGRRPIEGLGLLLPMDVSESDGGFEPAVPQIFKDMANFMYSGGESAMGDAPMMAPEDAAMGLLDFTGAGVVAGTPARIAAKEAGDTLLGSAGGLTPARKQRILKEVDKALDADASQSLYTKLKNQGDIINTPIEKKTSNILEPEKTTGLEGLLGETIIPLFAGRTSTGEIISKIGDMPLDYDIITDGGVDFMRRKDASGIFASEPSAVSRFRGKVNELNEKDIDPLAIYMSMGGDGLDFSTMALDTVISAMPASKILKKDIKDFDNDIRTKDVLVNGKKIKIDPEWVGISSPNIREHMLKMNGTRRALVMKELAKSKRQEQGFPDIGRIRRALTDDSLLYTPNAFGGRGILKPTAGAPEVTQYGFRHPSYAEQFSGDYVGRLPVDVPQSILFRDIADMYMDDAGNFLMNPSKGKMFNDSQLTRSIFTKIAPQRVDDQMLEEYDFYQKSLLGK